MQQIQTPDAPAAVGPYSQGIVANGFLFTAGQIAFTPNGTLVKGGIEEEMQQVMTNLQAVLTAAGCQFADVVQARIFIADSSLFAQINAAYGQFFPGKVQPARECIVAAAPVPGARVEISLIAALPPIAR
jgi:2-iminobutanoate/2-iminopropanoate deaminase